MLGLTLSCARCRSQVRPDPHRGLLRLRRVLHEHGTLLGPTGARNGNTARLMGCPRRPSRTGHAWRTPSADHGPRPRQPESRRRGERGGRAPGTPPRPAARQSEVIESSSIFDDRACANRLAMGVCDGEPIDLAVLDRGELEQPRGVAPGASQVLAEAPATGDGGADGWARAGSSRTTRSPRASGSTACGTTSSAPGS